MPVALYEVDGTPVALTTQDGIEPGATSTQLFGPGRTPVIYLTDDHPDVAEFAGGRVVVVTQDDGIPVGGCVISNVSRVYDDETHWRVVTGTRLWTLLGSDSDFKSQRAVVIGDAPESGRVPYGWVARSWSTGTWTDTAASGGTVGAPAGGPPTPDGWIDDGAEWVGGESWNRVALAGRGADDVQLHFAGQGKAFLNGVEVVGRAPAGVTTTVQITLNNDDLLAWYVPDGRWAAWTIGKAGDDGWERWYASSTAGATTTTTEPAGVTFGYIAGQVLAEVQGRGCLPGVTTDTTPTADSASTSWVRSLPELDFPVGLQAGDLLESVGEVFDVEADLAADAGGWLLQAWEERGTEDLTVDLSAARVSMDNTLPIPSRITHVHLSIDGGQDWIEIDWFDVDVSTLPRKEAAMTFGKFRNMIAAGYAARTAILRARSLFTATLEFEDVRDPRAWVDFGVGDVVSLPPREVRIVEIESVPPSAQTPRWRYTVEVVSVPDPA